MKRGKGTLASVHASIEATIVKLAGERARIDAELRALTAALNLLEAPPKATRATRTKPPKGKKNRATRQARGGDMAEQARMYLNKHDEVTPADFAKHTGTAGSYASTILKQVGKRVRTGVYVAKGN